MAMCEDFPCCGHELGCCPDRDANGTQLNMKCVCGATVPLNSHSSLCNTCLQNAFCEDEYVWEDIESPYHIDCYCDE
jgi:hypothetical protein